MSTTTDFHQVMAVYNINMSRLLEVGQLRFVGGYLPATYLNGGQHLLVAPLIIPINNKRNIYNKDRCTLVHTLIDTHRHILITDISLLGERRNVIINSMPYCSWMMRIIVFPISLMAIQ